MFQHPHKSFLASIRNHYASLAYFRDPTFALLGVSAFLDTMSTTIMVPLLPAYASRLGTSPVLIGILFAAPSATSAVLSTPFGHLADSSNRRRWIVSGMTLGGLSVIALSVAALPVVLLGLRVFDGVGAAMKAPASSAYIGDLVDASERASAFSAYGTASMVGMAVGPVVGGVLASVGGLSLPFFVLGCGTVLGGVLLFIYLPSASPQHAGNNNSSNQKFSLSTVGFLASVPLLAFLVHSFVAALGISAFHPFLSDLFERTVGAGVGYTGTVYSMFGIALVLSTPLGGSIADRIGRKYTLIIGALLWGVVAFGLSQNQTLLLPFGLVFLAGIASGILGPAWNAFVYELAPDGQEATLNGVDNTVHSAGNALGPILAGAFLGTFDIQKLYFAAAVLWVLNIGVLILFVPTSKPD